MKRCSLFIIIPSDKPFRVSRLRAFSEGMSGGPPRKFIDDTEIADILDELHNTASELIKEIMKQVRSVWVEMFFVHWME